MELLARDLGASSADSQHKSSSDCSAGRKTTFNSSAYDSWTCLRTRYDTPLDGHYAFAKHCDTILIHFWGLNLATVMRYDTLLTEHWTG